jgi:ABC-2 type transport system permease protein
VIGVVLGYRPQGGVPGAVAALLLVVVFSFGLSWVFTVIGLLLRSPNAVLNAGFTAIFPLVFLSNIFVEPETLPGPLEAFVRVNTVSILATACRSFMAGPPDGGAIVLSLAVLRPWRPGSCR